MRQCLSSGAGSALRSPLQHTAQGEAPGPGRRRPAAKCSNCFFCRDARSSSSGTRVRRNLRLQSRAVAGTARQRRLAEADEQRCRRLRSAAVAAPRAPSRSGQGRREKQRHAGELLRAAAPGPLHWRRLRESGFHVHGCHLGAAARKIADREGTHEGMRRKREIGSRARGPLVQIKRTKVLANNLGHRHA